jgi:phosphatidylserine/phosphatidylglycerophosphate/cardiolipin synthase-like enzyme
MGLLSRLAGTAITLSLAAGAYQYLKQHHAELAAFGQEPLSTMLLHSTPASDEDGVEHFSPSENLERPEMDHLKAAAAHARAVKRSLDIAIYAFTDRILAALLIREAEQGTVIRIYRDGDQYENEERNAARFRNQQSTTAMFRGQRNIHVRVKAPSPSDLMHLKAWSDGEVLREGSANWSPAALKRQDNNLRFSRNLNEVKAFEADFEAMWNRASNTIVQ